MASKGEVGLDLDISLVPRREEGMEPFEVMISESQERMLCVVEPRRMEEVRWLCERWEVRATAIGEVTDTERLRVLDGDEVVGDMPVTALVDDCPLYDLEPEPPDDQWPRRPPDYGGAEPATTLLNLLGSPNVASKRWAFEQYDSIVGSRTVRRPDTADAAVLSLASDGSDAALAVAIDGNGRRVTCDPYTGTVEAVLECARNLACVGAEPLGLTNCLNFGNPEKPHVAWQLERSVDGMADACRALGVPVVGGNVSLYNEGGGGAIHPTPVVGMVGRLPDPARVPGIAFAEEGHEIALVGPYWPSMLGSEREKQAGGLAGQLDAVDLAVQAEALAFVREAVRGGRLASAHDISDGGLACALAESCVAGEIGARVEWLAGDTEFLGLPAMSDVLMFGEGAGGVVVSGAPDAIDELEREAGDVPVVRLGTVGGEALEMHVSAARVRVLVDELRAARERALPDLLS
jgi:phosphoribosylformylglycinamidine synthase